MQDILFDSRLELDRLPLGAVAAGTPVRVGLRIRSDLALGELYLKIKNDADGDAEALAMERVWTENGYTRYEATVTRGEPGLYWYWFCAVSDGVERPVGREGDGAVFADYEPTPWQLTVYAPDFSTPDWIKGGVFYHIFIDRFCKAGSRPQREGAILRDDWDGTPFYEPDEVGTVRNNDFFGGNLDGVIEKLPYLRELGVTCVYLSPMFEAASNHKYDTGDYMKIDPAFGDAETFSRLCREAGELGIKIICDGVFNHTGDDSVYFDRYSRYGGGGAYNSKQSPYYPWYSFGAWPDEYEAWWGIKTLPQVREDNPEFREFILGKSGVLRRWMRAGASGWRLDVADELPEAFLRGLRETVKDENPDALIIGEVWEDATTKVAYGERRHYLEGRELDGVMNYPFKNAIIDFVTGGDSASFRAVVEGICENYPKPALDCLMNGLGTHDTPRILTVLGGEAYETKRERAIARLSDAAKHTAKQRLKAAALLQCALPGVPCVYYGDEAGLEGFEDPFNRRCYPWGHEDGEILDWYKTLLNARRSCAAFFGGDYRTLASGGGLFVFRRQNSETRAIAAVNAGAETAGFTAEGSAKTLIANRAAVNGNKVTLEPLGCVIIEL